MKPVTQLHRQHVGRALATLAILLVGGCSTTDGSVTASSAGLGAHPRWDNTARVYGAAPQALANSGHQATVVVFRDGDAQHARPINVYINGRFHSALLPQGHTRKQTCTGVNLLAAVYDDAALRHTGQQGLAHHLPMDSGQVYVFKVQQRNGRAELQRSSLQEFSASNTREQVHAVSRVSACDAPSV